MLNQCFNCNAHWSPGTEEWDAQCCSACGWQPGCHIHQPGIDEDADYDFIDEADNNFYPDPPGPDM